MERIFGKRRFGKNRKDDPITASTLVKPVWHTTIHRHTDKELSKILLNVGSTRLMRISRRIGKIENKREKEAQALKAKLEPHLEERSKLHNNIEETVKRIRKLAEEKLSSEGISEIKTLYGLLGEMEKNTQLLTTLGLDVQFSYKCSDIPIQSLNGIIHFISRIRANKIFREAKK